MATSMTESSENRKTHDLIGSDKVEGTNVYRSSGEKIGEIERVMLDKRGGTVAYAVMSFGGFLGLVHLIECCCINPSLCALTPGWMINFDQTCYFPQEINAAKCYPTSVA